MPGPAPTDRPSFTPAQLAAGRRVVRQHSAPPAQVSRVGLALLRHADPARDYVSAGRQLGKPEHRVRYRRRTWGRAGFRLPDQPGRGRKPTFPPRAVATGKALACALPTRRDAPLSRYRTAERARLVRAHPDAPAMSPSTLWRILDGDALPPRRSRGWLLPRDPQFAEQGGRVLDRYAGAWEGRPLHPDDGSLSAAGQARIQARVRRQGTCPGWPAHPPCSRGTLEL